MPKTDTSFRSSTGSSRFGEVSRNEVRKILRAAGEFLLLAVLVALVPATIAFDLLVFTKVGEVSVTEISQAIILLFCAGTFWFLAWKRPADRGFLVLVAGFHASLLIRESDALFDMVWHGFWFWPAMAMALGSIGSALVVWPRTIVKPMAEFADTKPYFNIVVGLVLLLVFSRIFGSGNILWQHVLEEGYRSLFRGALQEGLELLGYVFLGRGAYLMLRWKWPSRRAENRASAVVSIR